MITLVINEDEYRYGIGQLCMIKGIKIFSTMDRSFYAYDYRYPNKIT